MHIHLRTGIRDELDPHAQAVNAPWTGSNAVHRHGWDHDDWQSGLLQRISMIGRFDLPSMRFRS